MAGDGDSFDYCKNANSPYPEVYKKGKGFGTELFQGIADDKFDEYFHTYNDYIAKLNERLQIDPAVAHAMHAEFMAGMKCGDPVDVHVYKEDGHDEFKVDLTAESYVASAFELLHGLKTSPAHDHSKGPPMNPEQAASTVTQLLHSEMIKKQANDPVTRDDIVNDFNRLSKQNNLPDYRATEENGVVTITFVGTDL
jgi:hypothetical protein